MSSYLLLGPVLFQSFELPDKIAWGGTQRMAIHRLPGGARIIDSLGRDDADITWAGIFSGPDAAIRARLLDLLRADGGVLPLAWSSFVYSAVIAKFEAEYAASNWIPYRITCTVLRDEAEALIEASLSLGQSLLSDLADAAGYDPGLDLAAPLAAIAVSAATQPGTTAHSQATGSLHSSAATQNTAIAAREADLIAHDTTTADGITRASATAGTLAGQVTARSYLTRAERNLTDASV
jgi:hypothetical protein